MNHSKIKTSLEVKKKKGIQNLQTRQSSPQDSEQIAIQNLLKVSNHHNGMMIQQDQLINSFEIFGSTYFSQQNPQIFSMVSRMSEKINRTQRNNSFPFSVDQERKRRGETFHEMCKDKNQYQRDPERGLVNSASLRIRSEKNCKKSLLKQKNTSWLDSLKTETVFVGKNNQKLQNQKNDQKIVLQKYANFQNDTQSFPNNQKNHAKLSNFFKQLSFLNFHLQPTPLSIKKSVENEIINFYPRKKLQKFCQQPAKTQRLERHKKMNPFSQNPISIRSEFKEQRNLTCCKLANDHETMKNRMFDPNGTEHCFRGRHVAQMRQMK